MSSLKFKVCKTKADIGDLQTGEIVYTEDENKMYVCNFDEKLIEITPEVVSSSHITEPSTDNLSINTEDKIEAARKALREFSEGSL